MPVITIAMSRISEEKKTALIDKLTTAAAEATMMPPEKFFTYIQEYEDENIGLGGITVKEAKKKR